jgi:hypothetical protein
MVAAEDPAAGIGGKAVRADVIDIRDYNSCLAWLEALHRNPYSEQAEARRWVILVSHRAAMRALPRFWKRNLNSRPHEAVILQSLHACLFSGEAAVSGSLRSPLAGATYVEEQLFANACPSAKSAAAAACTTSFENAARFAADALINAVVESAYYAARKGLGTIESPPAQEEISLIRSDGRALQSGLALEAQPLWPPGHPWQGLWENLRPEVLRQEADWSFWVRWYDKAMAGEPQDWSLLKEIALIPPVDWDKGPEHVNSIIADKIAQRASELTPYAEEIVVTVEGHFDVVPLAQEPPATIQAVCDAVSTAVERIMARMGSGNLYAMIHEDLVDLQEAVQLYCNHPVRLHDELGSVWRSLNRRLDEELPRGDRLLDHLERVLDDAQIDLRREYREVDRAHRSRTAVRLRRFEGKARELVEVVAPAAAALSAESLGREMVKDPKTADEAGDAETRDVARYRWTSRISRMVSSARRNAVDAADDARKLNQGIDASSKLVDKAGGAIEVLRTKGAELLSLIW